MLLYISNGNVPSQWAHSLQIMKMAEAIAAQVFAFRLLIASDLVSLLWPRVDVWSWYGIARPFPVRRLPLWWRRESPFFDTGPAMPPRFPRAAVTYARLTRPALVWTRSHVIGERCLGAGLDVIFESHAGLEQPRLVESLRRFAGHPRLRGVVTISDDLRDRFVEIGAPKERIGVWPAGIDRARFAAWPAGPDAAGEARRAIGVDPARPLVLYAGSLSEVKGIPTLVGAARLAPELDFLLVGGRASEVAAWRERAAGLPNVTLRPFVANAELPRYFAAADACVVPSSRSDPQFAFTSPLKLREAMASGTPVVASALPAARGVLEDGENALVVPPDDAAALASALRALLADPALGARLAARAARSAEGFGWDRRARAILERFAPEQLG